MWIGSVIPQGGFKIGICQKNPHPLVLDIDKILKITKQLCLLVHQEDRPVFFSG